jgi:hypothetical protein
MTVLWLQSFCLFLSAKPQPKKIPPEIQKNWASDSSGILFWGQRGVLLKKIQRMARPFYFFYLAKFSKKHVKNRRVAPKKCLFC